MGEPKVEIEPLLGRAVVVDTRTSLLYLGTLERWGGDFVELSDCDVHDSLEARSTKEVYAMEAARNGVRRNRRKVLIVREQVVSLSALDDVVVY